MEAVDLFSRLLVNVSEFVLLKVVCVCVCVCVCGCVGLRQQWPAFFEIVSTLHLCPIQFVTHDSHKRRNSANAPFAGFSCADDCAGVKSNCVLEYSSVHMDQCMHLTAETPFWPFSGANKNLLSVGSRKLISAHVCPVLHPFAQRCKSGMIALPYVFSFWFSCLTVPALGGWLVGWLLLVLLLIV